MTPTTTPSKAKRSALVPIFLACIGAVLIVIGSGNQLLPTLRGWLPDSLTPIIAPVKYPEAQIVWLEESADRDPEFAVTMTNQKFLDSLAAREIKWRILDDDQPEAAELVKLATSPAMLFLVKQVTGEFKVVGTKPIPKSSKEANEAIAEVMGK